eukprot:GEMP01095736.1.p1 GENE.GEMP01095736.1~~GEMP01095736.1.p1  ORF type:complete len:192 (+),score=57.30 GEMP01095736.1:143-718(+)
MARVQAQYLGGNSVVLDNCDTVGSVMVRIANLHHRFASDVVVVCPDTGKNLTDPPSQKTPALVSVVLKQEAESPADDLRLTLRLHAEQEDSATCARALDMLRRTGADGDAVFLDAASDGNVKAVKTLLSAGVNANKNVAFFWSPFLLVGASKTTFLPLSSFRSKKLTAVRVFFASADVFVSAPTRLTFCSQ